MKIEIIKWIIIAAIIIFLGLAFWGDYNRPPKKYEPRIRQQQAFKMIKEIHEHLLGE